MPCADFESDDPFGKAARSSEPDLGGDGDAPLHEAEVLTDRQGLARILLDDQVYVLRITRQRKLILTK